MLKFNDLRFFKVEFFAQKISIQHFSLVKLAV